MIETENNRQANECTPHAQRIVNLALCQKPETVEIDSKRLVSMKVEMNGYAPKTKVRV